LSLFFLYLIAVCFRPSRKELYWVCVLTVLGGVMAAGIGYLFGLDVDAAGGRARGRLVIGDQDSNPNTLARVLLLPLALAIAGFVGSRAAVQKAIAVGCVGLLGVGMYISMSRTGLVSMMAVISVLLYRMRARRQIVVAMVVLLALSAAMPDRFYRRIGAVFTGEDSTGSGRTAIWEIGFEALDRFGVFGAGLANFPEVYNLDIISGRKGMNAHNAYLGLWVELGIIGLVLLLGGVCAHLLAAQWARRAGGGGIVLAAIEAACVGNLVAAFFADRFWTKTFWLAWVLLTWAVYCERPSDEAADAPVVQRVMRE
jgi:O-antigen ligase